MTTLRQVAVAFYSLILWMLAMCVMLIVVALVVISNIATACHYYHYQTNQSLTLSLIVAALSMLALWRIFRSKWNLLEADYCFGVFSRHL